MARSQAMYPQLHDAMWLTDQYVVRGKTAGVIACEIGCARTTVQTQLCRLGVSRGTGPVPRAFDPEGRECSSCRGWKSWDEFGLSRGGVNGRSSRCGLCLRAKSAWKLRAFELGLARKYSITLEQYEKMLADQGGVCALCGGPETRTASGVNVPAGTVQRLGVDHDHACCPGVKSCGKCVRGLLCSGCNWITGLIEARGRLAALRLSDHIVARPLESRERVG